VRIVDVSQLAIARARLVNGARGLNLFGLLLLVVSLIVALEGNPWRALLLGGFSVLFVVASRQVRRGNRAAAVVCGVAFVAFLLPRLPSMSPLELLVFVALGFFIFQGVRGAFKVGIIRQSRQIRVLSGWLGQMGRPKRPAIVAGLISLATVSVLIGIALLVRRIFRDVVPPLNELAQQRLAIQYLVDMVAFGLIALAAWSYRRAKRHLVVSASELRARDMRPPVLLLRSFGDDMIGIVQEYELSIFRRPSHSFEEVLTEHLWDYGPVIAIGRPGEAIPPLGAAREYIDSQAWQARVEELSSSSSMVVLILGRTQGVLWEIQKLVASNLLARTLIIFPPIQGDELRNRWTTVSRECGTATASEVIPIDTTLLILPSGNGEPLCVTGKRRRSYYYREALRVATETLHRRRAV
jgi:hypothetical protein